MIGALSWLTTWIVMIALIALVAQTSWGRVIVYWLLWLALLLLLVTHADELSGMINIEALQLNG